MITRRGGALVLDGRDLDRAIRFGLVNIRSSFSARPGRLDFDGRLRRNSPRSLSPDQQDTSIVPSDGHREDRTVEKGGVVITDEIASRCPKDNRALSIHGRDLQEISPSYFERPYLAEPGARTPRPTRCSATPSPDRKAAIARA